MTVLQERTASLDRLDLSAKKLDFDSIPLIDIADLTHPDRARRETVARKIGEACEHVGFFYVTNHGVPQALLDAIYGVADRFFAMPTEEKLKVDIHKADRHRGYVPVGGLHADAHNTGSHDLQEGFELSLELPETDPDYLAGNPMYGPNVWPEHPADFKEIANGYYSEMISLGRRLFGGFALALGLEESWFEPKIEKPMGQLRVLYYPPQAGTVDPNQIGIGAHTDYECFTILAQSEHGLQVQNRKGEWIAAPPIPGAFVVNIGDCMQRWTNDRFRSTVHRVINLSGKKRYSLAFFYGANYHATIECLPTCQDKANPPRHPPVKAGDWTVANIKAAYTYVPKAI
ncbi:2-oxoglutarate and iron-dependent oxygenase domain-containing protein [Parvibaculum sp.]|uniref:isopenicillin N synthase family dioxygenase n=1 Tax=Parvibaculum sp. TaxID=2024848 RepID=UPI00320F1D77